MRIRGDHEARKVWTLTAALGKRVSHKEFLAGCVAVWIFLVEPLALRMNSKVVAYRTLATRSVGTTFTAE
jgi:hypothetical protein